MSIYEHKGGASVEVRCDMCDRQVGGKILSFPYREEFLKFKNWRLISLNKDKHYVVPIISRCCVCDEKFDNFKNELN